MLKSFQVLLLRDGFQAIGLFNANQHEEAMMRIQELSTACPSADTLACCIVQVSITHSVQPRSVLWPDLHTSGVFTCPNWNHCLGWHASRWSCRALHCRCQSHRFHTSIDNSFCVRGLRRGMLVWCSWKCFSYSNVRAALRVGLKVLVANCKPETVPCTVTRRETWRSCRIIPVHDGYEWWNYESWLSWLVYMQVFSNVIPDHDAHPHPTQLSNKNAVHSMLATEMPP